MRRNTSKDGRYDLSGPPRRAPLPKTKALVLLDSEALRKTVAKACELARKKFEAATAEWERYRTQDVPEFTRELALCAGPLREELRVLLPKYEELADLLAEVMDEIYISGDDPSACLARIEAQADGSDLLDASELVSDIEEESDSEPELEEELNGDAEDDTWDAEEAAGDDFDDLLRRMMGLPPKTNKVKHEVPKSSRMKDLYRQLVRALHPDQGGHMTPGRMRLWHEVQDAYRKGDLARMEVLHSKSGLVTDLTSSATPISRLLSITRLFKKSLSDLKCQMRPAMADPAWAFSTLSKKARQKILLKSAYLLKEDVSLVKRKIKRLEDDLEEIRHPGNRSKRGRGNSKRRTALDDAYELFDDADDPLF